MESFAAVVRTLLERIRAVQSRRSEDWPPSAAATASTSLYRVAPTAWGVASSDPTVPAAPMPAQDASRRDVMPRRRQSLEISVFGLPVPRGLPAT